MTSFPPSSLPPPPSLFKKVKSFSLSVVANQTQRERPMDIVDGAAHTTKGNGQADRRQR